MFGKQMILSIALVLTAASSAAHADTQFDIGFGLPIPTGVPVLPGVSGLPGGINVGIGIPNAGVPIGFNGDSGRMRNGLPPTRMDSFVYEARENADAIYGDEGVDDIPPFMGFTPDHRINAGILATNNEGLTTGHSSLLPNAWGGDEYTGAEMSQSGPNSGFVPAGGINIGIGGGINVGVGLPIPGGLPVPGAGLPLGGGFVPPGVVPPALGGFPGGPGF
jgi:hypothetical protein